MNRSERDKLAYHCASMMYGIEADDMTHGIGLRILQDFPSIQPDFEAWAEVRAGERIFNKLQSHCLRLIDPRWPSVQKDSPLHALEQMMDAHKDDIIELLEDWREQDGEKTLAEFIDKHEDLASIVTSPSWRNLCLTGQAPKKIPEPVCQTIRGQYVHTSGN